MKITDYLLQNFDTTIKQYFSSNENWKKKYTDKNVNHDEPWITLVSIYALLGDSPESCSSNQLSAMNKLLTISGMENIQFSKLDKVRVEEKLPEIIEYRSFLKELLVEDNFHLYPDRREIIGNKIEKNKSSFEGCTNLDLLIEGISNGKKTTCFVEAKFLSDISYQTTYNPIRDQILRNIDSGIDRVQKKGYVEDFSDFYFFLLTPEIFKTAHFGCAKSGIKEKLGADSSRLYCYKMKEYRDWETLKKALPHRKLKDDQWELIAKNIGWISFEDIYRQSSYPLTIKDSEVEKMFDVFFAERNLK